MDGVQHEAIAAIRPVKESVEDQLLAKPGVVAVDIGEKVSNGKNTGEASIIVFVEQKKPEDALPTAEVIPKEVDGVKTDVQELVIELQTEKKLLNAELMVDATAYPTLTGGISIGPVRSIFLSPPDVPTAGNYVFVGTLGALVRDRATGATMAMTNFHVACVDNGWAVGDRMVQPSRVDGGSVATQQFGALTRAVLSDNTDGAVITVDAGHAWDYTVVGIGDVAGSTPATVGMAVQKRGRTTEHTFGTVASTDFTVTIDYGDGLGMRTLRHQIRINTNTALSARFSDHGDSGSVVMDTNRNVVGLLFAGSNDGSMTFANPIAVALDELGVDLLVRPTLKSRPLIRCFETRLVICDIRTREPICDIRTRLPVCEITRPLVICPPITRWSVNCPPITRPPGCDFRVTRPLCDLVTRGGPCRDDFDPRDIFNPGEFGRFGAQYATTDTPPEGDYWAGYLAALEEIATLDDQEEGGSS